MRRRIFRQVTQLPHLLPDARSSHCRLPSNSLHSSRPEKEAKLRLPCFIVITPLLHYGQREGLCCHTTANRRETCLCTLPAPVPEKHLPPWTSVQVPNAAAVRNPGHRSNLQTQRPPPPPLPFHLLLGALTLHQPLMASLPQRWTTTSTRPDCALPKPAMPATMTATAAHRLTPRPAYPLPPKGPPLSWHSPSRRSRQKKEQSNSLHKNCLKKRLEGLSKTSRILYAHDLQQATGHQAPPP